MSRATPPPPPTGALKERGGYLSLERLSEPLQVCHLEQRLALLLPVPDGPDWVPEREDRQQFELGRDVEDSVHLVESAETDPVRAHAIGPSREQHGLYRAARVGDGEPCLVGRHHYRELRL